MQKLRILVADDHEVVRRGVVAMLSAHPNWEVCAEAADGRDAVEKAKQLKPDIVILDLGMPNLNGLEAARQISRLNPSHRILILTITDTEQVVSEVLKAGAKGYLLKTDAARDLVTAVETLQHGSTYFNSRVGQMVLGGFLNGREPTSDSPMDGGSSLTPREREIVQMLAEGKSSKEVAVALNLSVKTAETHRSNIMRKLGLHSVSALVLFAVRNNIVQVPTLGKQEGATAAVLDNPIPVRDDAA
jgi:DNA-binding NarL/FixJ family response regulator